MSTETRQVFNTKEQTAKDILAAINTISPVISLIKKWGDEEKRFNEVSDRLKRVFDEIEAIRHTREILSDEYVVKVLSNTLKEKQLLYLQLDQEKQDLEQNCKNYENEVVSYMKYAEQFSGWIDKDILAEFIIPKLETQNQYWTILFLVHCSNYKSEYEFIKSYLRGINFHPDLLLEGWNYILNYLKNN